MRRLPLFLAALAVLFAFTVAPAVAQTGTYAVVADFTDNAAGAYPVTQLIQGASGDFYGGDSYGGTNNNGVIYRMTQGGVLSAFYQPGTTGESQEANLIQGSDGNLWGLDTTGGANGEGQVFKISPAGVFTTVYSFKDSTDGSEPLGPLVQASDGNFYGTAEQGGLANGCQNEFGANGCGTIFKVTPAGAFSVVYTFQGGADGGYPEYGLLQGSDGNFYGVQVESVYKLVLGTTPTVTIIATSDGTTDGVAFNGPLVEGRDGAFYGDAQNNGANAYGTIFKATASGITLLHAFTGFTAPADGGLPLSGLWAGTDGNFYGTNSEGGDANCAQGFGCGVVYKVTPAGALTVLYTFQAALQTNGVLGGPALVQGNNGFLYGTAGNGGNSGNCGDSCGVVFSVDEGMVAPVALTLSASSVPANTAVTLSWKANNAVAVSQQQCYAFESSTAGGAWTGKQAGTYSSSTFAYSGSKSITPTENGTYTYALTCGGTVSGFATLTVAPAKKPSTTELSATPGTLSIGQSVTLKATVSGSGGTPAGSVTFSVDGTDLATVTLSGGVASLPASSNGYTPGSYPVIATYSGGPAYDSSASTATTVTLTKAPTTTTVTASPNPVTPPGTETLKATVKRSASGATGVPTGTVTFSISGTTLGAAKLNGGGVATFASPTTGVGAGTYPVVATYAGDSSDDTSSSSAVDVVVK